MLCAICGEQWEWFNGSRWGAKREESEVLEPADARRRYEAFLQAETMDKQIAVWILLFLCLGAMFGLASIRFGTPDWRGCRSWLAVFRSTRGWLHDTLLGVGNAVLHPHNPAEITLALVILMMIVATVWRAADGLRRRKTTERRGVRGSSSHG